MTKKALALTCVFCSPMALALAAFAVPRVLGILFVLLQFSGGISFGDLFSTFASLTVFGGVLLGTDFVFIL